MLYKWSDGTRTRNLMTLTQHAVEDGEGITTDVPTKHATNQIVLPMIYLHCFKDWVDLG